MSERSAKVLENPFVGGLVVPVAIVLVGALVVFGVTRLLSTERSHQDLVREMQTRTFGNRWVAAYELSKLISRGSIPEADLPWVVDNLAQVMRDSKEPRTRKFVVSALGALGDPRALPVLERALRDPHERVRFHAVAALSRMPVGVEFPWGLLRGFLKSEDAGLVQVTLLTLATHKADPGFLLEFLNHPDRSLRFSAATGLINYKRREAVPVLKEILLLNSASRGGFDAGKRGQLKLNVLTALERNRWGVLNPLLARIAQNEADLGLKGKIKQVLEALK